MTPYPIIITTKNDYSGKLNGEATERQESYTILIYIVEKYIQEERPGHAGILYYFSSDSQPPQNPFLPGLWVMVASVNSKLGISDFRFNSG